MDIHTTTIMVYIIALQVPVLLWIIIHKCHSATLFELEAAKRIPQELINIKNVSFSIKKYSNKS